MPRFAIYIAIALLTIGKINAQENTRKISFPDRDEQADVDSCIAGAKQLQYRQPDSALALAQTALTIARKSNNRKSTAAALRAVGGVLYNGKMNYKLAKSYFLEALCYSVSLPHSDASLPILNYCIATCFLYEPNYDSASHYYFKGLELLDTYKSKDTNAYMYTCLGIGTMFAHLGKVDQSLIFLKKGSALAQLKKDTLHIADSYLNTGVGYANRRRPRDLDSALLYLHKAAPLYKKIPNRIRQLVTLYNTTGFVLLLKKDFNLARKYYDTAIAVDKDVAMTNTQLLKGLGELELDAGNYKKAFDCIDKGLKLSTERSLGTDRADFYSLLANAHAGSGNYKAAFEYQQKYSLLHDSIVNENMNNAVAQLELKYRTSEKDKAIAEKQLQLTLTQRELYKSRNKYIAFIATGVSLLIAFIAAFQKQRLQLQKAKVDRQSQKLDQLKVIIDSEEKEKSRIGRQIHDDIMVELSIVKMGLNALSISNPEIKNTDSYKDLVRQLNTTSQKLRQTAHSLMPDVLLEDGLIPAVSYFCNNIKKMTALNVTVQFYGNIPRMAEDRELNIYRIIQELLQNIIKHAKAKNVLVQLSQFENTLTITVEDNGIGFEVNQEMLRSGMGLKSIHTRLKALKGSVDFHSRVPNGTSVNISISI